MHEIQQESQDQKRGRKQISEVSQIEKNQQNDHDTMTVNLPQ